MVDRERTKKHGDETTTPRKNGGDERPPAGTHAKRALTNPDATPGAGALPDPDEIEIGGASS